MGKKPKLTKSGRIPVSFTVDRELDDDCRRYADDPCEFVWGPYLRSLARADLARRKADPRFKLRRASTPEN